ncbi:putative polyprotein, partial [Globisporangium splendens]
MTGNERHLWEPAINSEIAAHIRNGTWDIVPREEGMKVIGTKWLFARKKNEVGDVVRHKARVLALSYGQEFGVNYFETYSPVANMNSIRVFLAICTDLGFIILQFDVDTAFLNATLRDVVVMAVPDGVDAPVDTVCRLRKSLYGLKQASYEWNQTIHRVLDAMGFTASDVDPCIYVLKRDANVVYLCLYVDDMLIAARDPATVEKIKLQLQEHFQLKELGAAKYVLGMEISQNQASRTTTVKQTQYIRDITERFNQESAKAVENPCIASAKTSMQDCPNNEKERGMMRNKPYRSLIGCLLYVSICTRPDISFAVGHLSRYVEDPGEAHWREAIRVLRYLSTTREYGIKYSGGKDKSRLTAYSDADWASNADDRRSISGVILIVNGGPVVYKSKAQKSVALSSSEAEYMAASLCAQEIMWTRALLADLQAMQDKPTTLFEDSQGAIALTKNMGYQGRAKHIDIRYHFVREKVKAQHIDVRYVETERQLADILTKVLPTKRFEFLRLACGIQDLGKQSAN